MQDDLAAQVRKSAVMDKVVVENNMDPSCATVSLGQAEK